MTAPWSKTPLQPCGTHGAYQRHRRRGEEPCQPCKDARAAYQRKRYRDPDASVRQARADALEALAHRHPEEFRRLYAAALQQGRDQQSTNCARSLTGGES